METSAIQDRISKVVESSKAERARVRMLVSQGRRQEAEPEIGRLRDFTRKKIDKLAPPGAESIEGGVLDWQAVSFLPEGAQARRAVAYVEVNTPQASEVGSGFLVSPRLLLTCQHVIHDVAAARGTQITFDREMDELGRPRATSSYVLDPDTFALFSDETEFDYALVAVGRLNAGSASLAELGVCALSNTPDRHVIGMNVNIIQHPRGWPKMMAIRNNLLTFRTETTLLYETDTDTGSSGAPVFNDNWELVALHHWGQPFLGRVDEQGQPAPPNVNEGVRISRIYNDLESRLAGLPLAQQALLKEALAVGQQAPAESGGNLLSAPHAGPAGTESLSTTPLKGVTMGQSTDTHEFRITVPIEITVRVGTPSSAAQIVAAPHEAAARTLTKGAEALKIDADYSNRSGYQADFIPGFVLALPAPNAALRAQVAPLLAGEPNLLDGELKYEHFSLKMNKSKRIAIFTATNIDGETYLNVDRTTGLVSGSEGETWFRDPRISTGFYLDQTFYAAWSSYFDRGHLTRRSDPTWGTAAEAERANADTFHFTNCSPQHFRFNETAKYWQGAERYILENGIRANAPHKRICVFQGPIFNNQIDLWAADAQIPSSFFKIVVWKGALALKAVGMVVDQLPLLSETRKSLGSPHEVASVNVNHWRVALKEIERRTKLNFGDTIRAADTISAAAQPLVGAEALRPIRAFSDLLD